MSITRFHPPFWPGTKDHMPMDRSSKGVFVLYKDHKFRVDRLLARIEELEKQLQKKDCDHEWHNLEYNQLRSIDVCSKCGELRTGRGNH